MIFSFPAAPPREAECLTIRALRHWVSGPAGRGEVWREFSRRFAPDHAAALRAFERCLGGIAARAKRHFRIHPTCGAAGYTADEAALLRMLAALQRGDMAGAIWHAGDFLAADGAQAAAFEAKTFADALLAGGLSLGEPAGDPAWASRSWLEAQVVPLA